MMKLVKETVTELKRVTFPNKKKLIKDTSLVIGVCIVSSVFLFAADTILNMLLALILN